MQRNLTLDYFKLLLSILVILIHLQPLTYGRIFVAYEISNGLARIAVPCFFIINGYFIDRFIDDGKKVWNYILHLFLVYVVWTLIYGGLKFPDVITAFLTGGIHLWYVPALIGAVLIVYAVRKMKINIHLTLGLVCVFVVIGYYIQNFTALPEQYSAIVYRNCFFEGFPFVFMGYFLKQKDIISKLSKYKIVILGLALLFSVTLFAEVYIGFKNKWGMDIYLSLLPLCALLFILVMFFPKYSDKPDYIQSNLPSGIYFSHMLVLEFVLSGTSGERYILLPEIIFLTILLASVIVIVNKRIKIFI
ncbi:surface polysaccharide O-acyltransferase-like enzyme [Dysgonomonas sp. PH5-45]|uniref:acyltransferase family protein n=1 Tax=unclassified Dysgonomonas TaxID=2630389 RepID=UPI002473ADE0|nr:MULTISPECIES: acyltransferase family protein [unclassified Dysgonomonas]MDH6355268.1 surface polysaccharide O-acyltransferase-like enzyme [Dysgonomonas sp. PH5-45]MDH6388206.1 surface polysaccharide O-acyltransferase-like enzyme [Dysgonomonas sp. PH5-37]